MSDLERERDNQAYAVMTLEQHHASQDRWLLFERKKALLERRSVDGLSAADVLRLWYGTAKFPLKRFIELLQELDDISDKAEVRFTLSGNPEFFITFKDEDYRNKVLSMDIENKRGIGNGKEA